jgi:hypothetical protein
MLMNLFIYSTSFYIEMENIILYGSWFIDSPYYWDKKGSYYQTMSAT